jgi:hypothetical protein
MADFHIDMPYPAGNPANKIAQKQSLTIPFLLTSKPMTDRMTMINKNPKKSRMTGGGDTSAGFI